MAGRPSNATTASDWGDLAEGRSSASPAPRKIVPFTGGDPSLNPNMTEPDSTRVQRFKHAFNYISMPVGGAVGIDDHDLVMQVHSIRVDAANGLYCARGAFEVSVALLWLLHII